jgi:glycosyltransferase involved in cell wall biosynthesis
MPVWNSFRVAVICDFLEERWPSMDLVGDMLGRYLAGEGDEDLVATQLRPKLRPRLGGLPLKVAQDADRLLNRFADYPRWLRCHANRYDLFHIVDHSYSHLVHALPPGRSVVTCHDLDTFRCILEPERDPRPVWFRIMTQRILEGFRKAAHVIAVSRATREELLRFGLFPPEQITVIHNGIHPSCSPDASPAADLTAAKLLETGSDVIWVLSVGSNRPRKRLDVLLRVVAAVRKRMPSVRLARVGDPLTPLQQELADALGISGAIVNLPFLERDILAAVYRRAALLVHTAEAEGFGLPVLEAMASGCPVIASDIGVLREIGGSAVAYCPVADVEAWARLVTGMLGDRMGEHRPRTRREEALERAARFTWAENARRTTRVYRKVLGVC